MEYGGALKNIIAIAAGMYATHQLTDAQSQINTQRAENNQVRVLKNERDMANQQLTAMLRNPKSQAQPRTNEPSSPQ